MITFDADVYDGIIAHARDGKPHEICGVLGGKRGDDNSKVEAFYEVENVSETPRTNYLMDSEAQLQTIDTVEEDGYDVVGFYHSHPEGANQPSETDAARANWPSHSYVIVSLAGDEPFVGSWRWTGEEFEDETVRVRV
ncbi:MAG: desampylase [Halobacteria archaeon]|nr:desampylase [Halobacteria archaeon]